MKYFVRAENFANEEFNNLAVFNFWMEAGTFMSPNWIFLKRNDLLQRAALNHQFPLIRRSGQLTLGSVPCKRLKRLSGPGNLCISEALKTRPGLLP